MCMFTICHFICVVVCTNSRLFILCIDLCYHSQNINIAEGNYLNSTILNLVIASAQ